MSENQIENKKKNISKEQREQQQQQEDNLQEEQEEQYEHEGQEDYEGLGEEDEYDDNEGEGDGEGGSHSGSDNIDTSIEHEFHLSSSINPLGGRNYNIPESHPNDNWNFNLVANIGTQLSKATAVAGSILPIHLYRKKTFTLTFNSKNIPFEFMTNSDGYVIVSHVSKSVDSKLHRGVVILGVNDTNLSIQLNASEDMEKLIEQSNIPFTITFEELNEGIEGDRDNIAEYEEESVGTKTDSSIEDEEQDEDHRHIHTQYQHDDSENYHHLSDTQASKTSLASVASTSANIISSSLFSLTSKVKAFVTPVETQRASKKTSVSSASSVSSTNSNRSTSTSTSTTTTTTTSTNPNTNHLHHEYHQLPDNSFELILPTRSPPFVFDLHADGNSIVVVKIIGDKKSLDPRLQEGCVVRCVNDIEVNCKSRQEFDQLLNSIEETPLRLILEHAPALYRHQDALSLYTTSLHEQAIHIFTVMPNPIHYYQSNNQYNQQSYEDVYTTSQRALQVLQAFRAQGVSVDLVSMETVLIGSNSAYAGTLNTTSIPTPHQSNPTTASAISNSIVTNLTSMLPTHLSLLRGIRVWFRFSEALQITIQNPSEYVGALEVTRNGENATWIVIRCIAAQSPWIEEGMILGRPYLVTHVNGYDVSAAGYRSISQRINGNGEWESSILPYFNFSEINLTIV